MAFLFGAEFLVSMFGVPSLVADGIVTVTPPAATLFAGKAWGRFKERRLHGAQVFRRMIMVQRNTVVKGKNAIRGLHTGSLEDFVLGGQDPELTRFISQAASETTESCPGLLMGSEKLQEQMWTAIQGSVSPMIDRSAPRQLIAVTCERYAEMKQREQRITIRVMLVSEQYLKAFQTDVPLGLGIEAERQSPRRDKFLPWMAQMHFKHGGIHPESGLRVVKFVDDPWKDDETAFLAQRAA